MQYDVLVCVYVCVCVCVCVMNNKGERGGFVAFFFQGGGALRSLLAGMENGEAGLS